MSIAIIFNQKQSEEWLMKMQSLLPNTKVEVYPNIINPSDVDFIVTWKPHQDYIQEFPNLKVIQSVGAGIDHLLHTQIPPSIKVTRIIDPTLKQDMFEHVLTCIMSSMKNFPKYHKDQIQSQWNPTSYQSIKQTTVTILGLGEIGYYVAEKLVLLGFKVKGWSNSKKDLQQIESFAGQNELVEAISKTNFIVNILPLTKETKNLINKTFFDKVNDGTCLINVGRGAHVNEKDLLDAIEEGKIAEAYLDVFSQEPLHSDHPFWINEQIYITPHIASITHADSSLSQVVENYRRMQDNVSLLNVVDIQKGY